MTPMDRFEEMFSTFARVASVAGVRDEREVLRPLADRCGWGRRHVNAPLLPSGLSHGVPYGISFVLGAGAPELRVFLEPQAGHASIAAFIAEQPGADVRVLERVRAPFSRVWYAVAFRPDGQPPAYRAYLCLPPGEREALAALTLAALEVEDRAPRGPKDFPTMIGIDLHAKPRIKLYVLRPDHVLDHPFARALPGGDAAMGWLSCHFLESTPPRTAWHYSAARHAPDDEDLARRLRAFLASEGIDPSPYDRLAPLRHHFVTYQRVNDAPRVTVYLLPDVLRP